MVMARSLGTYYSMHDCRYFWLLGGLRLLLVWHVLGKTLACILHGWLVHNKLTCGQEWGYL